MVDLTTTRAQAINSCEGGQNPTFSRASQNIAVMAMQLDTLPLSSADGVDRLHCQLVEITTIATAQLAECARWHQGDVRLQHECRRLNPCREGHGRGPKGPRPLAFGSGVRQPRPF
jgi:hypothetical protein